MKTYPRVLTIAGSDSGGGAGIQADIKAISATGGFAASAITAVTAQNTLGVREVHCVPVGIVRSQIRAVMDDIGADAVKIGMLGSAELVLAVRDEIKGFGNIVLDPVMVATSGDRLTGSDAIPLLKRELAPYARLLTPNIPEAEAFLGERIISQDDIPPAARALARQLGEISGKAVSVLLKAGHLDNDRLTDCLFNAENGTTVLLGSERIRTVNTHGTGCTLSSAIASFLAQGFGLEEAVRKGKQYLEKALAHGAQYSIGTGHGPVDHFFNFFD